MARLLYFARVREEMGRSMETLPLPPEITSVATLLDHLRRREPYASALTSHIQVAVNQRHASPPDTIGDDDEIAFFPPVSGG
ncbi:MAG: molybdopterin converting factor subunit 1 [Magnetococcales bacterium]|nr:molybdopterin converting factor subunit 1 [Magnetococcales bacterium]